jgi:N-acetylmuramoyl-L-alanine amidase
MKKPYNEKIAALAVLSTVLIGIVAGCAPRSARYSDLYARLREEPDVLDLSALTGRRIVIDPGHGGHFEGAIGADSLTEADVNLGVALYLWGLLNEAGAVVAMTRSTDRDFLPEESTELDDDLARRIQIANEFDPDVFISIHHNANLPVDRELNKIEVYYRGDDPDASLDLARDIRLHLARNLGITETDIKPGNYYVLRNSKARASVLGEASYISHPVVEERLKLANKQRIEAESYFLGLVTYFSRGAPTIERLAPAGDTLEAPAEIVFSVERGGNVPLDISSAKITIGDREVTPLFEPSSGTLRCAMDADARNGAYIFRAGMRSTKGGASAAACTLMLSRPARYILPLPLVRDSGGTAACRLKILDELGQPVADGLKVAATSLPGARSFHGTSLGGTFAFEVPRDIAGGRFIVETTGLRDTISFDPAAAEASLPLIAVDKDSGKGIPFPQANCREQGTIRGNTRGFLQVPHGWLGEKLIVSAEGYRPARFVTAEEERDEAIEHIVPLAPILGGILKGKRIGIDPAGGGSDHAGIGPNKIRGASINLDVAKRLSDMLVRAGATALLTRTGEETIGPEERVYRINSYGSELAIGIHHGTAGDKAACRILSYPGSARGGDLAAELSSALRELPPCTEYAVSESVTTFLQQTSCPACEIHSGSVHDSSSESILSHPLYVHLAAERILSAILRHFGENAETWPAYTIRVERSGQPVEGASVCIDQTVNIVTDSKGLARFTCIDPGTHSVTIDVPGEAWREILFIDIGDRESEIFTIHLMP